VAIIALFAALTGSSYAEPLRAHVSALIGGKSIKKRAIGGKHVKRNAFTGFHIRERRLAKVPSAAWADSAASADSAATAATATNAGTLDGKDSLDFADGKVTLSAGRTTGEGGPDPNNIRTFNTPVGRFELNCGIANADARYRNTTGANLDVYRTILDNGAAVDHEYTDAGPGDNTGYAATVPLGPAFVELSAASGSAHARFRVHTRRVGTTCTWNWELLVSR
jgi:hypothetical protein